MSNLILLPSNTWNSPLAFKDLIFVVSVSPKPSQGKDMLDLVILLRIAEPTTGDWEVGGNHSTVNPAPSLPLLTFQTVVLLFPH